MEMLLNLKSVRKKTRSIERVFYYFLPKKLYLFLPISIPISNFRIFVKSVVFGFGRPIIMSSNKEIIKNIPKTSQSGIKMLSSILPKIPKVASPKLNARISQKILRTNFVTTNPP